ncbi:hypothetical protein GpartN1_g534.t1 [Galdieria partita]|uniref:Zn(2)-C6 fungal-type domain-containing protein n=1 Tax=Galdieria partita TaxID=83374 RepID=A0A9C7PQI2_9RHOD|nr:hypothetical protein GpartN1_g534.t1 [Galdieria partita]
MDPKTANVAEFLLENRQEGNNSNEENFWNEDISISSDRIVSNDINLVCGGSFSSAASFQEVKTTASQHKKRRRVFRVVRVSCTHCRQAKQACDDFRPCMRCVRLGLQDSCVDAPTSRPRRGSKTSSFLHKSSSPSVFQMEGKNRCLEPEIDKNDSQNLACFDQPYSSLEQKTSCSSNYVQSSGTIQIIGVSSAEQDLEASQFQSTTAEERISRLFIPVDCLTRGKPLIGANLNCQHFSNSKALGEACNIDVTVQGRSPSSYSLGNRTDDEDCFSFVNAENPSVTKSHQYSDEENYSDLIYSLSMKEGLIFVTGKIWNIMFSWDRELQDRIKNLADEQCLDMAKSEILFYFVAKSIERYVQFFSSNMTDSPYCNLFALNAAVQSLDSAGEEFAQRMVSLLPPKSPVLSDDQQNLFLESVPIAALKMSVSLDDSWHKILYVNGECCDLFGTTRRNLIELLSDPSSLHIIFVDNGWIVEPLKTLVSLRKGVLKRKSTFRLRSFRNEILDCLISTSFGTDSNWLPKHIIFYIQSFHKLDNRENYETSKESAECSMKEMRQTGHIYTARSVRDSISVPESLSSWNSVPSDSISVPNSSYMERSSTGQLINSEQHLWPHV